MNAQPRAYRVSVYHFDRAYGVDPVEVLQVKAWSASDAFDQVARFLQPDRAKVISVEPWTEEAIK